MFVVGFMLKWGKQRGCPLESPAKYSYAIKLVPPAPRSIRPIIDPTLEIIDTAPKYSKCSYYLLKY